MKKTTVIAIKGYWCRIETAISPSQLNASAERTLSTGCLSSAVTGHAAERFAVLSKKDTGGGTGEEEAEAKPASQPNLPSVQCQNSQSAMYTFMSPACVCVCTELCTPINRREHTESCPLVNKAGR